MNLTGYISAMPKVELHLHFEGAIAPEDLLILADKNRIQTGYSTLEDLHALYNLPGFDNFRRLLLLGVRVIREPDDLYFLMQRIGTRMRDQNIVYAEVFWTPQLYRHLGIKYDELFSALCVAAGELHTTFGTRINWIPDLVRNRSGYALEVMEWATRDESRDRGVVALGLAGPETGGPLDAFADVFHAARERGLPANPHAGEGTSPGHVLEVLDQLRPSRIGHGISAVQDPDLLARLASEGVGLEICLTSNISLGHCKGYSDHPLSALIDAGCKVTINTDDPALFRTDLNEEYRHAVMDCGITLDQLQQSILDAISLSYLDSTEKAELIATVSGGGINLHRTGIQAGPAHTSHQGPVIRSAVESTSYPEEAEQQQRWRLREQWQAATLFDQLVENEFHDPEDLAAQQAGVLRRLMQYAQRNVPYYRNLLETRRLQPADFTSIADLQRLPVLDKQEIRHSGKALQSRQLPRGEKLYSRLSSSGTTGRPVTILQTVRNNTLFHILNQRHYRWYRLDPEGTLAFVRLAGQLPRMPGGQPCADNETVRLPRWRYVGNFFQTGPWLGFNITNPVEHQLQWLCRERPDYLASYAESLEHLCFAAAGRGPVDSIRGTIALSEQLTPSMRSRIVQTFNAPVFQGYGLSEIGMVAIECLAGRFHVHVEHCIVEIVNDQGIACPPGTVGRIVVTALNNYAMPLIRYDTDDLARAVSGPCACGRSLPGFGELTGRYSRIAYLPADTMSYVAAVRNEINAMPDEALVNFRQYQLHQYRETGFELRLVTSGELPALFYDRIHASWNRIAPGTVVPLSVIHVDCIERTLGGKTQDFTSDYMPAMD